MPRFFFNHTSHNIVSVDDSGTEFPSLEAAYLDTCDAILDLAFEKLRARQDPMQDAFEIISEDGDRLVYVPFSEILRPHQAGPPTSRPSLTLAASARLIAHHKVLKSELSAEFAKTASACKAIEANLARLAALVSPFV
jgi:hypothetical protein